MDTDNVSMGLGAGRDSIADRAQMRLMARLDGDGSGSLSTREVRDFARIAQNFVAWDSDGSGTLSGAELGTGLADLEADRLVGSMLRESGGILTTRFDGLDLNGNGALSDAELMAALEAQRAAEEAARMRDAKLSEMMRMDTNADGRLSAAELQAELTLRAETRAMAEFERIDTDGDGVLSDAELQAAMPATAPPPPTDAPMPPADSDPDATTAVTEPEAPTGQPVAEDPAPEPTPISTPAPSPISAPTEGVIDAPAPVMSLIESVFDELLADRGIEVATPQLNAMTQALYTEAQDILQDGLTEDDSNSATT
ncbi:MAG: hypothetical protein AAF914_01910 [Pseudomonadota bacterium]